MIPKPIPKATIEREARAAAADGKSIEDACPYPYRSDDGMHFIAVYLLSVPPTGPCEQTR